MILNIKSENCFGKGVKYVRSFYRFVTPKLIRALGKKRIKRNCTPLLAEYSLTWGKADKGIFIYG
jgi:hypothetical protein